ncbi:MAG: 2-oxoacid:acceptor oxidoreductase family protein [Oscillospiraceae bacterium]|nr:2-oxoacid:acceptor oxidoreductase family protein [Oscillospiraceae bacterium]
MRVNEYLIAGFGGQGVLFAGKLLANIGLVSDKQVTWMPSYGPAMRGGVCNCSVCISDLLIGSPVVHLPDTLICMNSPSFDKYVPAVKKGGAAFIDSSIIDQKFDGKDITCHYVPATKLAVDNGFSTNFGIIVMLGKVIKESGICDTETVRKALETFVSAKKASLIDTNIKAIELGLNA